jgi:putative NIF3 family GTP cyclohydrolase 1 type 2
MPTLGQIAAAMERLAPSRLAESWDNVGLQIGDPRQEVSRIVTALECDPAVVAEAREAGAQAVVAHHPLFFRPATSLRTDTYTGRTIADLVAAGMGFLAAHTNVDKTRWGTNGLMARRLKLRDVGFLHPETHEPLEKLVVFVPTGHYSKIIDAIDDAGGGCIGRYRRCTFRTRGTGGFQGDETAGHRQGGGL